MPVLMRLQNRHGDYVDLTDLTIDDFFDQSAKGVDPVVEVKELRKTAARLLDMLKNQTKELMQVAEHLHEISHLIKGNPRSLSSAIAAIHADLRRLGKYQGKKVSKENQKLYDAISKCHAQNMHYNPKATIREAVDEVAGAKHVDGDRLYRRYMSYRNGELQRRRAENMRSRHS